MLLVTQRKQTSASYLKEKHFSKRGLQFSSLRINFSPQYFLFLSKSCAKYSHYFFIKEKALAAISTGKKNRSVLVFQIWLHPHEHSTKLLCLSLNGSPYIVLLLIHI
jgi:hypothetical protein